MKGLIIFMLKIIGRLLYIFFMLIIITGVVGIPSYIIYSLVFELRQSAMLDSYSNLSHYNMGELWMIIGAFLMVIGIEFIILSFKFKLKFTLTPKKLLLIVLIVIVGYLTGLNGVYSYCCRDRSDGLKVRHGIMDTEKRYDSSQISSASVFISYHSVHINGNLSRLEPFVNFNIKLIDSSIRFKKNYKERGMYNYLLENKIPVSIIPRGYPEIEDKLLEEYNKYINK